MTEWRTTPRASVVPPLLPGMAAILQSSPFDKIRVRNATFAERSGTERSGRT